MHFQNIDFDFDIEVFDNFDIDIGINIEKNGKILEILVVRKRRGLPDFFCLIFYSSLLSFENVS